MNSASDDRLVTLCSLFKSNTPILDKDGKISLYYQNYFRFNAIKSKFEFINGIANHLIALQNTIDESPLCILTLKGQYDNIAFILECQPIFNEVFFTILSSHSGLTPIHTLFQFDNGGKHSYIDKLRIYRLLNTVIPKDKLEYVFFNGIKGPFSVPKPIEIYKKKLSQFKNGLFLKYGGFSFEKIKIIEPKEDESESNKALIDQIKVLGSEVETNPLALLSLAEIFKEIKETNNGLYKRIPILNDVLLKLNM